MLSFHVGCTHATVPMRRSVNNSWESAHLFYCVDSRNYTQVVRLAGKLSAILLPPWFIVHIDFWPHLSLWWPLERVARIWPEMWEQYSWVLWALILVEEVEVNRQFWFTQSWMVSGSQVKCITMSGLWETGKSSLLGMGVGHKALHWMLCCSSPGWFGREEETGRKKLEASTATFLWWQMNRFFIAVLSSSQREWTDYGRCYFTTECISVLNWISREYQASQKSSLQINFPWCNLISTVVSHGFSYLNGSYSKNTKCFRLNMPCV